jgi:hypothetical protein
VVADVQQEITSVLVGRPRWRVLAVLFNLGRVSRSVRQDSAGKLERPRWFRACLSPANRRRRRRRACVTRRARGAAHCPGRQPDFIRSILLTTRCRRRVSSRGKRPFECTRLGHFRDPTERRHRRRRSPERSDWYWPDARRRRIIFAIVSRPIGLGAPPSSDGHSARAPARIQLPFSCSCDRLFWFSETKSWPRVGLQLPNRRAHVHQSPGEAATIMQISVIGSRWFRLGGRQVEKDGRPEKGTSTSAAAVVHVGSATRQEGATGRTAHHLEAVRPTGVAAALVSPRRHSPEPAQVGAAIKWTNKPGESHLSSLSLAR